MSHTKELLDQLVQLGVLTIPDVNLDDETALKTFVAELTMQQRITEFQRSVILGQKLEPLILDDRYLLCDYVGGGGMGLVYQAFDCRVERTVAIKMLRSVDNLSGRGLERFHREIVALGRLRHPNIITAYDAGEHNGSPYLVMELVEGRDLGALVSENGPLAVQAALRMTIEAAVGLYYAHRKGVIHRDIKPSNLMLELADAEDDFARRLQTIKILDLGLARVASKRDLVGEERPEKSLTVVNTTMGTVDYMAPEQASNAKMADHRSDIYSLGCTLYYLLTGQPMYDTDNFMAAMLAHVQQPIPSLCEFRSDVPPELDAIFAKMVAKEPDDRFQTWSSLIKALEHFVERTDSASFPDVRELIKGNSGGTDSGFDQFASHDTKTEELPGSGLLPQPGDIPASSGSQSGGGDTDDRSRDDSIRDGSRPSGQSGPAVATYPYPPPKPSYLLPIGIAAIAGVLVVMATLMFASRPEAPGSALELATRVRQEFDENVQKVLEENKPPIVVPPSVLVEDVTTLPYTYKAADAKTKEFKIGGVSLRYYNAVEFSLAEFVLDKHGIELERVLEDHWDGVELERLLATYGKGPEDTPDIRIPFRLVSHNNVHGDSFYMMETEVWNDLFAVFAKLNKELMENSQSWIVGASAANGPLGVDGEQGRLPVVNVDHLDAFQFAYWLGGRLPTQVEWDIAAGCLQQNPPNPGPYQTPQNGGQPAIAIRRIAEGPLPVGTAEDDISVFGIHDLTGNAQEFTCTGLDYDQGFAKSDYKDRIPPLGKSLDFVLRGSHYQSTEPWNCFTAAPDAPSWSGPSNLITFRIILKLK